MSALFTGFAAFFAAMAAIAWGAAGGLLFAVVAKQPPKLDEKPKTDLEVALAATTGVFLFEAFAAVVACAVAWVIS